jgi:hypothetical protein
MLMQHPPLGKPDGFSIEWETAELRRVMKEHTLTVKLECLSKSEADGVKALLTPEELSRVIFTWRFQDVP